MMGFNKRKIEDQRREAAEKEAAIRRATDAQVLEDAERLIAAHLSTGTNSRPRSRADRGRKDHGRSHCLALVPGAACPTINAIDLRTLDRHLDAAVTSELVRLSRTSIADEMREEHRRRVLGE